MEGFSERNLDYMRTLAQLWPNRQITQRLVAKLPWGHNTVLLDKRSNDSGRLQYAQRTIENGWSRNVLVMQIESNLMDRSVRDDKTHNFSAALPAAQSDLALHPFFAGLTHYNFI